MPHYAVFCAAHKRRLSAGTGLGAAATAVSSLEQQAKLLSNVDLPRNTDAVFLLNRPSPVLFHAALSVPSVRFFSLPWWQNAERGCQDPLLFLFILSFPFTAVERHGGAYSKSSILPSCRLAVLCLCCPRVLCSSA